MISRDWPAGPREQIAAAIARTGCVLRPDPELGGFVAVDCPTHLARAELVDAFATRDAEYDGRVRQLALELVQGLESLDKRTIAAAIQYAVATRVRYIGEAGDKIQDSITTWSYALGDCDCQARLVLALLRALGIRAELVAFSRWNDALGMFVVKHVCAALEDHELGRLYLETTLPVVVFGQNPYETSRRFGLRREDLT